MKKIILFLPLLIACNNTSQKVQVIEADTIESMIQQNKTSTDDLIDVNDTTIYNNPPQSAILDNAGEYFRANNKYKDWDAKDKKVTLLKCIIEKDGSVSNLKIFGEGSGNKELDNEATRLIKDAKIDPAKNEKGLFIRSWWMIAVEFPPK